MRGKINTPLLCDALLVETLLLFGLFHFFLLLSDQFLLSRCLFCLPLLLRLKPSLRFRPGRLLSSVRFSFLRLRLLLPYDCEFCRRLESGCQPNGAKKSAILPSKQFMFQEQRDPDTWASSRRSSSFLCASMCLGSVWVTAAGRRRAPTGPPESPLSSESEESDDKASCRIPTSTFDNMQFVLNKKIKMKIGCTSALPNRPLPSFARFSISFEIESHAEPRKERYISDNFVSSSTFCLANRSASSACLLRKFQKMQKETGNFSCVTFCLSCCSLRILASSCLFFLSSSSMRFRSSKRAFCLAFSSSFFFASAALFSFSSFSFRFLSS